jgi:two-component sensor histidine kinase
MPMSDGSIDFRRVLEHSPNPYLLLDAELRISWANHAYLAAVGRELDDIAGSHVFDAFPGAGESHHLIESSFERVLETGESDEIAHLKYDIPNASGGMDAHIWSTTQVPILDDSGAVRYILQHPVQITKIEQRDTASVVRRAEAVEQRWRGATKELERLRALLEQAPGFVAVLAGPEHRFVMSNAAYRRLIGERDLDGKSVAEALPEIAEQGFVDILDKVMETGEPYFGRREKVMLKSGEHDELRERHLEFIFQPISGPDRFDGVLVQGYDVTEEVLAEDSQRILINELNHRVKNTLAVVQGLAQQSFKGDKQNPQLDIFVERLAALASAHSLLTERRWESADLRTIVRGALEATAGTQQSRYTLDGPDIRLEPQPAVALSMVIHELSTNAVKYGAFSTDDGSVDIQWSFEAGEDGGTLILDWRESGGPSVATPDRTGFGSRLIQRGLGTPGSRTTIEYLPDGLHCRLEGKLCL